MDDCRTGGPAAHAGLQDTAAFCISGHAACHQRAVRCQPAPAARPTFPSPLAAARARVQTCRPLSAVPAGPKVAGEMRVAGLPVARCASLRAPLLLRLTQHMAAAANAAAGEPVLHILAAAAEDFVRDPARLASPVPPHKPPSGAPKIGHELLMLPPVGAACIRPPVLRGGGIECYSATAARRPQQVGHAEDNCVGMVYSHRTPRTTAKGVGSESLQTMVQT